MCIRDRTAGFAVERYRPSSALNDADVEVILQILADAGKVEHDRHAFCPQILGRADAGEEQELR